MLAMATSDGFLLCLLALLTHLHVCVSFLGIPDEGDYRHLYPYTCISVHVRTETASKSLSYVVGALENLRYPKDRVKVQFITDLVHKELIAGWTGQVSDLYAYTQIDEMESNEYEQSLRFARTFKCEYVLITTSDVYLEENALAWLKEANAVVVSGLVKDPTAYHSNGVGLVDPDHISGEKLESWRVYFARPPLLIHIGHKDGSYLTFDEQNIKEDGDWQGPLDVFAHSAYSMDIPIYLTNQHNYGYLIDSNLYKGGDYNIKLASFLYHFWLAHKSSHPSSPFIQPWTPPETKKGFDEVYVINLKRRPERRRRMEKSLRMLGFDYKVVDAVDGQHLSTDDLHSIRFMPNYVDPFHKRPMTRGEIGCFLSHHRIWEDIVRMGHARAIVFEDDIQFAENATMQLKEFQDDLAKTRQNWDLVYFGRKKNNAENKEFYVSGHRYLSTVTYSYWTLAYAISHSGAQKLLQARPLDALLALDEFLPIMYDSHPNETWKSYFPKRDLAAFTLFPLLVYPERYLHEPGYVSDTESSDLVNSTQAQQTYQGFSDGLSLGITQNKVEL